MKIKKITQVFERAKFIQNLKNNNPQKYIILILFV